jgi:hypothetical protein
MSSKVKAAGALLLVAALALGFLARYLLGEEESASAWKGYRVLLVDKLLPEGDTLAALRAAGLSTVISESTEPVLVSNWKSLETMSLAEACEAVAPEDPRWDSYLRRLELWFEARSGGKEYRVFYLKSESSIATAQGMDAALFAALKPYEGKYILPRSEGRIAPSDRGSLAYFLVAVAILLAASAAGPLLGRSSSSFRALSLRKPGPLIADRLAFRLALLAPWLVLASKGLFGAALAALWGLAIAESADKLDLPLDELRNGGGKDALASLRHQPRPSFVLPAVALLSLLAAPSSVASVALALAGSIVAAAGYTALAAKRSSRRRFTPLPIGGGRASNRSAADRTRATLACVAVLAWGLCRLLGSGSPSTTAESPASLISSSSLSYPSPVMLRGAVLPLLAEARSRAGTETGSVLPGLASYLEHKAIQEALPYLPVGEARPDPFAPLSLPEPTNMGRELKFDEAWARKSYAELPSLSVEAMLLSQGGATVARSQSGTLAAGRPLAPIECLLYIFLLIPPIGRLIVGAPFRRGAVSGEIRQEA